jgi:hypothetical protein
VRIEPVTPELVYGVARAMRERDYDEFSTLCHTDDRESLAIYLASTYGRRADCFILGEPGWPIAVFGAVEARPRSLALLFFATERFPRIGLAATRMFKRDWLPAQQRDGIHRIEVASLADYRSMHRWLEFLGFRREADHPMYGKRRETFTTFAWTADV